MTQQAFDALAHAYDRDFTGSPTGHFLRSRVRERLLAHWKAGDHILELGCGTGADAVFLAQHDIHVTATDTSAAMLTITREKAASYPAHITVQELDLNTLPASLQHIYDGILSSFGPLNCLDNWQPLAQWLSSCIKPGGIIGFGIMGPFCLWEMGWHSLHLNFKTAFRRFRKNTHFQIDDSPPMRIRYPTIKRISTDFAPHFRRTHVQPLGIFLPPSDIYGVIEKRPRLHKLLIGMEQRLGSTRQFALFADHYWIEFERV